jgi:HD superfamily phosphohydrolase
MRRIQDAVHGLMEFRHSEAAVIDVLSTPELQRLARIRQQGLTYRVFPAAEHSRLIHSLGTAYLAVRFCQQLIDTSDSAIPAEARISREDVRCIALAALCHDLGHGPLSHTWEREVIGTRKLHAPERESWRSSLGLPDEQLLDRVQHWHELVTQALLFHPEGILHQKLTAYGHEMPDRIRRALLGEYRLPFLTSLLSSDVDCDRCDFVKRDALMSGVAYGNYDLNWLISTLTLGALPESEGGGPVVGFDRRKSQRVIEQFLIARRAMYDMVYWHKTVRSAERMIGRFLARLRIAAETSDELRIPFWPSEEPATSVNNGGSARPRSLTRFVAALAKVAQRSADLRPDDLLYLDDTNLMWFLSEVADSGTGDAILDDLARRIINRDLFKEVRVGDTDASDWLEDNADHQREVYEVIARSLKLGNVDDAQYYLIEDEYELELLSPDESAAVYLIDTEGKDKTATSIQRDDRLMELSAHRPTQHKRIFVPEGALAKVRELIRGKV